MEGNCVRFTSKYPCGWTGRKTGGQKDIFFILERYCRVQDAHEWSLEYGVSSLFSAQNHLFILRRRMLPMIFTYNEPFFPEYFIPDRAMHFSFPNIDWKHIFLTMLLSQVVRSSEHRISIWCISREQFSIYDIRTFWWFVWPPLQYKTRKYIFSPPKSKQILNSFRKRLFLGRLYWKLPETLHLPWNIYTTATLLYSIVIWNLPIFL